MNVLITGLGTATALCVVRGLRRQKGMPVRIVGTDTNERHHIAGSAFVDTYHPVPPTRDEDAFVKALSGITRQEGIDLLIPIIDSEIEIVSRRRGVFPDSTFVLASPHATVRICNDKLETSRFFRSIQLATPLTYPATDEIVSGVISGACTVKFPVILKPRSAFGSRGLMEVASPVELGRTPLPADYLLQEKVFGQEYTVDVFSDGSRLLAAVPRIRLETKAGVSTKGETVLDPGLVASAGRIVESLRLLGPANIQCFQSAESGTQFIEINPRFSGGLALTIEAGVNTPAMALQLAAAIPVAPIRAYRLLKMCRYWDEVYYPATP